MSKRVLTWKEIAKQAVSDWFGKDVQSGYTLSYIWMSNEMGHFSLGFIITLFLVWGIKFFFPAIASTGKMLWVPFLHAAFWIIKEMIDFIAEVVQARKKRNFPVNTGDIFKDMLTADFYFSLGIAIAYSSLLSFSLPFLILLCSLPVTVCIAGYWLSRKICFQRAGLPFQFRLGDFEKRFSDDEHINHSLCCRILEICSRQITGKHFLVFGQKGTQKTSLAIGMATEWTFHKGIARYTTYFKFLQLLCVSSEPSVQDGQKVWPWRKAGMLVVDDVNPGVDDVASCSNTSPHCLKTCLMWLGEAEQSLARLKEKTTVWIIGNADHPEEWKKCFVEMGFPEEDLILLTLLP